MPRTRPRVSCHPSAGCARFDCPRGSTGIRVDTGVEEGDAVTPFYDPMIAKIIAHGADRIAALERLASALDVTQVDGVTTNLAFLRAACASPAFREMRLDTGWLDREGTAALAAEAAADPPTLLLAALATVALSVVRPGPPPVPGTDWTSPWHRLDAWRLNQPPRGLVRLLDGKELHVVSVEGTTEGYTARLGEAVLTARCGVADGRVWVESEGLRRSFPAAIVGHTLDLHPGRPAPHAGARGRPLRRARRGGGQRPVHRTDAGQGDQAPGGTPATWSPRASRWRCSRR